ncbi:MAG TPA: glutamine amidotransferase [Armatimonadota bacterium]
MILTKGFPGFCHASTNLIAGMTMTPKGNTLAIAHTLGRSWATQLKDVTITAKLRGVDSKEEHDLPALTFGTLSWEPKTQEQTIQVKMNQRLVCDVTLTGVSGEGKPIRETYSYYWPGSEGEKFDLMTGISSTTYRRIPPKKVKEFLKPKGLAYYRKPEPRMLEMRGPFYQYYRVPEAAVKAGISVIHDSYLTSSFGGTALTDVPGSYEEIFRYDLLVLNNVTAASLTDFGQDALREFVKAGGNVLVIGGQFAFGAGGYRDSVLADILPVEMSESPFSLRQLTPPGKLKVASTARILAGRKLRDASSCFWRNEVTPKAGAWVELTAGEAPILICGKYGQGKVAVVAGTVCGEPAKGEKAFWDSEDWPQVLTAVIRWMLSDQP